MPGPADVWWDDLRQEAELPPAPPPARRKAPLVAGALAAVALSGGLAWWFASPSEPSFQNQIEVRPPPPAPIRLAGPTADAEQVRRAYEEFGLVYANSGPEGLARFAESCAQSLRGDPRILDFCLAFDLFTGAVRDEPAGKSGARRLAMVQAALPDADPDARIAEVQRLMRDVTGIARAAETTPAAPSSGPPAPAARSDASAPPRPAPARKAASPCRGLPTADRLVCQSPTLKVQDRRMKAAYERALAAGADPLAIDRGQAEWRAQREAAGSRAELADLYARRVRELNAAAEAARTTPPT